MLQSSKKNWSFIFFAFILILFSSCTVSKDYILEDRFRTEEELPGFDMQNEYAPSAGSVCRSGSVYYYYDMLKHYIYYYDESTGTSGKLCGKAECTHDTRECNAYSNGCIQIYDGKLYFIGDTGGLYRMDLSGNNREFVMVVRNLNGSDSKCFIHRGYVYSSVITSEVAKGKASSTFSLYQQRLGQTDTLTEITKKSFEGVAFHYWIIRGNRLYLSLGELDSDSKSVQNELSCYHIQTGELETLWSDRTDYFISQLIADDTGINMMQDQLTMTESYFVRFDLESRSIQQLLNSPDPIMPAGCFSQDKVMWYGTRSSMEEGKPPQYQILDVQGSLISEGYFPSETQNKPVFFIRWGGDEKGFLFNLYNMENNVSKLMRIPYEDKEIETLIATR